MVKPMGAVAAIVAIATSAAADRIAFDGKSYDDVYIAEGASMYYIHLPDTGEVLSVRKDSVPAKDVHLTPDREARNEIRNRWNEVRDRSRSQSAPAGLPPKVAAGLSAAVGAAVPAPTDEAVTDGQTPHLRLRNVPLRQALKGVLRPMNLDYKVEDGYIRVSTPQRIRTESAEPLETRYYDLRSSAADTLPKVVAGNMGGVGGAGGLGGGLGGGFGGGGLGGFGGGGLAGGGAGGATFSNISQLFSNIDDRLVGEPPAVIMMQPLGISGGNANYRAHHGIDTTRPRPLSEVTAGRFNGPQY